MFRKVLIFAMFATAAGYCYADGRIPQVTTSEVFGQQYQREVYTAKPHNDYVMQPVPQEQVFEVVEDTNVPAWPIAGSDADVVVSCDDGAQPNTGDNVRIVSKIGDDMMVENNFNFEGQGWSGGANMLHGRRVPMGFDDECENGAEMPLLRRDMLEDDGGNVLTVSRSGRKNCTKRSAVMVDMTDDDYMVETEEIAVDGDAEASVSQPDQVRSWVVTNGQTLREVLQKWCDQEGWDLVWATSREYPIEASAVFKGRFADVASALVRNFGRATPVPYAKFYKGNLVLVISTNEE